MLPTRPVRVSQLKTLRKTMRDPDVVILHMLLNYHLGPPDDQLPVTGSGSADFGPRTEAKVKRFQEVNGIDRGNTSSFKDGVVGPHTWKVLNEWKAVVMDYLFFPELLLTPPSFPKFPPLPRPSFPPLQLPQLQPPSSPTPLPQQPPGFFSLQIKAGESGTIPFADKAQAAHAFQLAGIFLVRKNSVLKNVAIGVQDTFHLSLGPLGGTSGDVDKHSVSIFGTLTFVDLPGSGENFTWTLATQAAFKKSLLDSARSAIASATIASSVVLKRDSRGDTINVFVSAGLYGELRLPSDKNKHKYEFFPGVNAFEGFSVGIVGLF